jgi:hypothetical protein
VIPDSCHVQWAGPIDRDCSGWPLFKHNLHGMRSRGAPYVEQRVGVGHGPKSVVQEKLHHLIVGYTGALYFPDTIVGPSATS